MGENHFAPLPTAVYGAVLFLAAVAYLILETAIVALHGSESKLGAAIGKELKGKVSLALYVVAILLAFVNHWISNAIYVGVAMMWLIPDPRIESRLGRS
jgi:uncharacterized membrane protein